MSLLFWKAYLNLLRFEIHLSRGSFHKLYEVVRDQRLGLCEPQSDLIERICSAVNLASIWYWKEVFCLQRAAATVCLLKAYGIPAQLFIGVQSLPFKAHAWAEVGGRVVNDKPYVREIYAVLDCC